MPDESYDQENDRPLPIGQVTHDFFRYAVANVNDAVIVTTPGLDFPEPVIVYVNAAFEEMTGYSASEVVGQSPRLLQGPGTSRALLDRLKTDLKAGREFHGETVNYRKDGREYYVEWRVSGVYDGDELVNWVAIQRDVTARVRQEEEMVRRVDEATSDLREANDALAESNDALAASNRDMATFTYTVSHDLRQPARAIIANARWLRDDYGHLLPEEAKALLARQESAAIKLGTLIDDLLKLSRLGRTAIVREPLDVTGLVSEIWSSLDRGPEPTEFRLQEGMTVEASGSLLRVVYQNLLENALKFRLAECPLRIEVGRREDGVFFVRDNGSGFDPQYAKQIFEPFERLHRGDVEGTGFGLHNSQRIAEQHGGTMWADGRQGEGAIFFFTL